VIRVLLSEGSSLTAREVVTCLGPLDVHLEVLDPDPLCLARFSRWVRAVHRCPRSGADPLGYLECVWQAVAERQIDVEFARLLEELGLQMVLRYEIDGASPDYPSRSLLADRPGYDDRRQRGLDAREHRQRALGAEARHRVVAEHDIPSAQLQGVAHRLLGLVPLEIDPPTRTPQTARHQLGIAGRVVDDQDA
jgi:hypothetical protein